MRIADSQTAADAERWRAVEPLLIAWRDADNFPAIGSNYSPEQARATSRLAEAVDAIRHTLKLEQEGARR